MGSAIGALRAGILLGSGECELPAAARDLAGIVFRRALAGHGIELACGDIGIWERESLY